MRAGCTLDGQRVAIFRASIRRIARSRGLTFVIVSVNRRSLFCSERLSPVARPFECDGSTSLGIDSPSFRKSCAMRMPNALAHFSSVSMAGTVCPFSAKSHKGVEHAVSRE